MNNSMISSLVSMQTLQKKIDTIANNIANINTVGYKGKEVFFSEIMSQKLNQPKEFSSSGRKTNLGLEQGFGAKINLTLANFTQGTQLDTGLATDFMLRGEDIFFTVIPADGDPIESNDVRYTRDGHFQLDAYGYLLTSTGDYVLNTDDEKIQIPENTTFNVDKQGRITIQYPDGEIEELGYLKITRMINPKVLETVGNNQYQIPKELIERDVIVVDEEFDILEENYANKYSIVQGSLEGSNVDLVKEMTQLTDTQRAYQFLSRGLSISDQMMGIANNLKG
ncbi:hypothetical protein BHF71_01110 [Vulcanibacillus modesticaldus]|uniref:Uncharacterized protein n=1 Tax=Vulcanibacillus modesticaldus TaxID=337097 RepID=A0A1D2YVR8_9BACI|nr:flagellar hook-basal body protein [Vulcanibacillus modesticaldus]OEF99804.1 hypothetical protein BHF71_01110 [Vulcanibacillus modesticaldus]